MNRLGFSKRIGTDDPGQEQLEFYLTSSGLKEILRGLDLRSVIPALLDCGIVPQGSQRSPSKTFHVPNLGNKVRLHQLDLQALRQADGPEDD